MPLNISTQTSTGLTAYATISYGDVDSGELRFYDTTLGSFLSTADGSFLWYNCDFPLTEDAVSKGSYSTVAEITEQGTFTIKCYAQAGMTASGTADTFIGASTIYYDGNQEVTDMMSYSRLDEIIRNIQELSSGLGLTELQRNQLSAIYSKVMNDYNSSRG